ncbi:hypothetical protein [Tessaracoccus sp. OH4464_COT-324]|uniref:hypothetical protein n=1 Tax=Tessaracoccus sp. OH4464_COT-324 TaxID=2491059 RepID=UPI000F63AC92|nr:hypothetical protein [Tessaracoccus sp. OH4464_COT-324]RRD46054.1 hypothetical protein EII42_08870 [Tessaracoccus sp. OH4464_COT-324]
MYEWEQWARSRSWVFHAGWQQILDKVDGGGLLNAEKPVVQMGFEGRFGSFPCYGFRVRATSADWASLDVLAVRISGVNFPELQIASVLDFIEGPRVGINDEFDLEWQASCRSEAFARDVITPKLIGLLRQVELFRLWFEGDSVLISVRRELDLSEIDAYLTVLHRIAQGLPDEVLKKAKAASRQVPGLPGRPSARMLTHSVQLAEDSSAMAWQTWTRQRQWLYTSGIEIHSRMRFRVPVRPDPRGFVGKFGHLPVFGFNVMPMRNVVGVRVAGHQLPQITLWRDTNVLAQMIGSGGVYVGDPEFDDAWRVESPEPARTKAVLNRGVRECLNESPPFAKMWFGYDALALLTTRTIGPQSVDGLLTWLVRVAQQLPELAI